MRYVFENCELDASRDELLRDGQPVPMEPQVFDLIKLLVTSGGRVVSREEIFESIWGNRIVSDAALSSRIKDARKAIGDDGTQQRFIRTIQRRGLRFVADTCELDSARTPDVSTALPGAAAEESAFPGVAIFPIVELEDSRGDFFAEGLTDELTAALSAWRYFPILEQGFAGGVGAAANVAGQPAASRAKYAVSGKIRRSETRIKVQVTLKHLESGQQIWSDRIVRETTDLIDMEEEIAAQLATLLIPELEGFEARRQLRRPAADLSPWELTIRAAWLLNKREKTDFSLVADLASRAADGAPDWVLPYALIAWARFQQSMSGFSGADSRLAFSSTLDAARQALEIDRGSWLAHALTAVGELWTNRNHDRANLHVARAIELNKSASMNYHFGGCICGFSGQTALARTHQERLLRMDPVYPYRAVIEADLGLWHLLDKEFSDADDRLSRAQMWDPRYGRALQRRLALCGLTGDHEGARKAAMSLSDLGYTLDARTIAVSYPFLNTDHSDMFLDGLRSTGLDL